LTAFELAGGIYVLLTAVIGFLFSYFVPYFVHLQIIRSLFKVDNNSGKPQKRSAMIDKSHDDLVNEAKEAH